MSWTLPDGWQQEMGTDQTRYATIFIGKNEPLELKVTSFPNRQEMASVLRNVTRWRDQLGLDPLPESELGQNVRNIDIQSVPMALVDITGYHVARKPMFASRPKTARPPATPDRGGDRGSPLSCDAPNGWKKLPAGGIRLAAFLVKEGEEEAEVTIVPLGAQAGTLLANVNRWRGELGLEPTTEARLNDELRSLPIDGIPAHYVDLVGPRSRILVAMLQREDSTWFFKMKGSADLVGRQKPAFESFVKSVKFTKGAGN
jgi:hypothetical protein